ncbi:MAG: hypothetical protein FI723_00220, partial [SAR202 cluster bacterium]|nr:hypothetical protein [SAR202 cluster bacterium]
MYQQIKISPFCAWCGFGLHSMLFREGDQTLKLYSLRYIVLFPNEETDRLLANLKSGKPSLCAYVFSHPNMVEVAGIAGIDCFMADMMFTAHDWDNIAHLVRAARGTGISPMIRVQSF